MKFIVSVGLVALSFLLSFLLAQHFSYGRIFPFTAAVILTAWYGGQRVGLLTTGLSVVAIGLLLTDFQSTPYLPPDSWLVLGMFAALGVGISWLEGRRQAEAQTSQLAEKRFQTVTRALGGLIYDYDILKGETYRSAGLTDVIGVSVDEMTNQSKRWVERIHPDDMAQRDLEFAATVARQQANFQSEYRIRHKDGHYVWAWDNGFIFYNEKGQPVRIIGCTLNIDARKRSADQLAWLQSLTEGLSEAVTLAHVAEVLVQQSVLAVGATSGVFNLYHADTQEIEIMSSMNFNESLLNRYRRATIFAPGASPRAAQTRQAVWFHSRAEYLAAFPEIPDVPEKQHSEAIAALPLLYQGRLLGVLGLYFGEVRAFLRDEQAFLLTIARQCAIALERAQLYEAEQVARRRAEQTATWLTRLQFVTASLSQALTSHEVAKIIVDSGMALLGASSGVVALSDEAALEIIYSVGIPSPGEEAKRWRVFFTDPALSGADELRTGRALWLENQTEREAQYPALTPLSRDYSGAWALLPLHIRGAVLGGAAFIFPHNRPFLDEEKEFMLTLAHYCSQALERARLYETTKAVGAEEERKRLARELHDAVTQTLFSASLMADSLTMVIDRDVELARQRIAQLVQLNRAALAEMRTLLLELRPEQVVRTPMSDLLTQLTQAVPGRKPIDMTLTIQGNYPLPSDVHIAFYRVAQETLNNIIKHSNATQGDIFFDSSITGAELRIRDNGVGFDPASHQPGFGLDTMQERSLALGASIHVSSQIGNGTEITMTWKPMTDSV